MICDICGREQRIDECYIQRPTANNPSGVEDVCLDCNRENPVTLATEIETRCYES